jgi:hypothetical protein
MCDESPNHQLINRIVDHIAFVGVDFDIHDVDDQPYDVLRRYGWRVTLSPEEELILFQELRGLASHHQTREIIQTIFGNEDAPDFDVMFDF